MYYILCKWRHRCLSDPDLHVSLLKRVNVCSLQYLLWTHPWMLRSSVKEYRPLQKSHNCEGQSSAFVFLKSSEMTKKKCGCTCVCACVPLHGSLSSKNIQAVGSQREHLITFTVASYFHIYFEVLTSNLFAFVGLHVCVYFLVTAFPWYGSWIKIKRKFLMSMYITTYLSFF